MAVFQGSPDTTVCEARRRLSRHGAAALVAMLVPAMLFPAGLVLYRFSFSPHLAEELFRVPWQFWMVALCGSVATVAGAVDWCVHRSGVTTVGRLEHRAHFLALGTGGLPLFGLMALASFSPRPEMFLVPVLVVLIYTVVLIAYDEFVFHRRCEPFETLAHRLLTFGNGLAFLAWAHWCFVERGGHG